jgi:hypothetical protein
MVRVATVHKCRGVADDGAGPELEAVGQRQRWRTAENQLPRAVTREVPGLGTSRGRRFAAVAPPRVAQRRVDQRIGHPAGDLVDLAIAGTPDVLQHDVGLDAEQDRQRLQQPVEAGISERLAQRRRGAAEDGGAVAAPERLLAQFAGPLKCPVFQGKLHRGAQLRFEVAEARKHLGEQLVDAGPAAGTFGLEAAHRAEAFADDRVDELASARKVAIGSGARDTGRARDLGHGQRPTGIGELHRSIDQQPVRACARTVAGSLRRK